MTKIDILYEDSDILAVNKPAGLVVHSDGRTKEKTLCDWILKNYPKTKDVGEPIVLRSGEVINRPGIVHRLDRETSGVILIAKTKKAHDILKKQFKEHTIKKTYNAFVYGNIREDEGVVDRPISRSKKDFRMWSAQRGGRGEARDAVTEFKVLKRLKGVTFVEARPLTGRTHQIRVHFKALNNPVVCDKLYASNHECLLGFDRLALHAREIIFKNVKGKEVKVEAPYPTDFKKVIKNL